MRNIKKEREKSTKQKANSLNSDKIDRSLARRTKKRLTWSVVERGKGLSQETLQTWRASYRIAANPSTNVRGSDQLCREPEMERDRAGQGRWPRVQL